LEKAKTYLQKVTFDKDKANAFIKCFLVCFKHDLPDMRGGATYAEMFVNHQSKSYNYVIHSKSVEMIIIVYNRYKTVATYGTITEVIEKEHPLYDLFEKAIYIANMYQVPYLFYDYEKDREYNPASFNLLIEEAHEEIKLTQLGIRRIDASIDLDGINPAADMGKMIKNRKKRGHSLLEGLSYANAKRLRQ
jgi:hypothetical protein